MKIGIFLPNATFDLPGSPEVGGIETFSFTVGEALQRLGHEVVLFGGAPKAGRSHRATSLTLELNPYWETRSIPDLGTRFQRLVQRLHFAWTSHPSWRRHRCDILLLAKPFDWPVAWWWKRSQPELKAIMGFHGTDFFMGDRTFYGAIDKAFAVSAPVAKLAEAHVGTRPTVIPNPGDVEYFTPVPAPLAQTESWRLVATGRLVGWKGFATLIEAIAILRDVYSIAAHLTLAGSGPELDRLKAQGDACRLTAQVDLCGRLDRAPLRDLLRAGDLYVLPSVGMEAFSIGALEAACTGLPLVLSDRVGLADFLGREDAEVFSAGDAPALASLLKKLHERRYDTAWMDRAARHARLRERFSPERAARSILDLIA